MVRWSIPAERDLRLIHNYIAQDPSFVQGKLVGKSQICLNTENRRNNPEFRKFDATMFLNLCWGSN